MPVNNERYVASYSSGAKCSVSCSRGVAPGGDKNKPIEVRGQDKMLEYTRTLAEKISKWSGVAVAG